MINALKTPSFLRPSTRPSSPVLSPLPDPLMAPDRTPRPHSKLSLSSFRRTASPSPAPGPTPATVTQDGSYMEVLGLKLSEAVSKAVAQPTGPASLNDQLAGRRSIPPGRGRSLGALIASEIKASRDNPHLYRAIIRTLHRPLSVLLSNLSGNLLSLLLSPAFSSPLTTINHNVTPNATQLHAIGIATVAGELLETFDELGLGLDTDMRGDGLKAIREGLASVVKRVIDPAISGIKAEVMPLIEALENVHTATYIAGQGTTAKPSGGKPAVVHPSIASLQASMPGYARALSRYVTSTTAENALASFLISLVWRGLVALSHRPVPSVTPPASPVLLPSSVLRGKDLKRRGSSLTPPITPPSNFFNLKLPPSRPPSPPAPVTRSTTAAADARALYDLLATLPRPSADKPATRLAREAVDEAFAGLHALAGLLDAVQPSALAARGRPGAPPPAAELGDLDALTADMPVLVALPVLLRACGRERGVPALLGLGESEYRAGCLGGFGRAEECAPAVAQRVCEVLGAEAGTGTARVRAVAAWLEREIQAAAAAEH